MAYTGWRRIATADSLDRWTKLQIACSPPRWHAFLGLCRGGAREGEGGQPPLPAFFYVGPLQRGPERGDGLAPATVTVFARRPPLFA